VSAVPRRTSCRLLLSVNSLGASCENRYYSFVQQNRDEFSDGVKAILAHRAGYRCSKPSCRALTAGPSRESDAAKMNIGVAAHITGAAGGRGRVRYDPSLSPEERRSVTNGIWLCQTHAKEVDDDELTYTVDILRAWKRHAEEDARAMLGKPVSAQSLAMTLQVVLHRADNGGLVVAGTTNLPNGTKLLVQLLNSHGVRNLGDATAATNEGMFAAGPFTNDGSPHPHAWYRVEVIAYFNAPWQQSEAVLAIVGHEGEHLIGRFAEPVHPEFEDSETRLHAVFDCIAPPIRSHLRASAVDLKKAIEVTKAAVLTVDGRGSALPVGEVVREFVPGPGMREFQGWSATALSNGAVLVSYSFWNDEAPCSSEWLVTLTSGEVRYRNVYAKLMSWAPDY